MEKKYIIADKSVKVLDKEEFAGKISSTYISTGAVIFPGEARVSFVRPAEPELFIGKVGVASPGSLESYTYHDPDTKYLNRPGFGYMEVGHTAAIHSGSAGLTNNAVVSKKNQALLVELVQNLQKHDEEAVKKDDLEVHDASVHDHLDEDREFMEQTIRDLYEELQKGSLRNRLSVFTTSAVLLFTGLTLLDFLGFEITLISPVLILLLLASILFWIMAKLIPPLPEIKIDERNS